MIHELLLRNLGVIDSSALEFGPGLNVITGETGAGKSMLLGGLGLILGARADRDLIRAGADSAFAEAVIDVNPEIVQILEDLELDTEGDQLQIVRTMTPQRSRASAGGFPVPGALLQRIGGLAVTVHGQSDQQRLLNPAQQRELLDQFGGEKLYTERTRYVDAFEAYAARFAALEQFDESVRTRRERTLVLQHTVAELEALDPQPGELEQIRIRIHRLENMEELTSAATLAHQRLSGADDQHQDGLNAILAQAAREAHIAASLDAALHTVATRLDEALVVTQEAETELASYTSDLSWDPGELNELHQRVVTIQKLARAHAVLDAEDPSSELQAILQQASAELLDLDDPDAARAALQREVDELWRQVHSSGELLARLRTEAATGLADQLSEELKALAMPQARLHIDQRIRAQPARWGLHDIVFTLQSSASMPPRPLAKAASGGELSRIMLALEVVLATRHAQHTTLPTFIFDEVDSGIGGATATAIGRRLAALADHTQVIVVTHLAQVAAFADRHLVVTKNLEGPMNGETMSQISHVSDGERITEIARMLSGDTDSPVALEHAKELITAASVSR